MRHNRTHNHLGRTTSHRHAMLSNMASSLIIAKRINTTLAKARALRVYVEPLITRSKNDTTHSRRMVFRYLQNKDAVTELFREVAPKVAERPGGYVRIIKLGNRAGDNAEMCMMELVDFNAMLGAKEGAAKAKKTTRRSSTRKKAANASAEAPAEAPKKVASKAKKTTSTAKKKADDSE